MRVLLTSVGRRNYLVSYFRSARYGGDIQVFGADVDYTAPGLAECDKAFVVPATHDQEYLPQLLALCREYDIDLLVPLSDLDVAVLAGSRKAFAECGVIALVLDEAQALLCSDKMRTFEALREAGIPTPETVEVSSEDDLATRTAGLKFPVIVKPRFGSASVGLHACGAPHGLADAVKSTEAAIAASSLAGLHQSVQRPVLIQEKLEGEEVGLDVANDLDSNFRAASARRKLAMRAGETDKAETIPAEPFLEIARGLSALVAHRGNLDCDLFVDGDQMAVLEMNARFGGGYPFSHEAGFDLVSCLVAWAGGDLSVELRPPEPYVIAAKCDRLVRSRPRQ